MEPLILTGGPERNLNMDGFMGGEFPSLQGAARFSKGRLKTTFF